MPSSKGPALAFHGSTGSKENVRNWRVNLNDHSRPWWGKDEGESNYCKRNKRFVVEGLVPVDFTPIKGYTTGNDLICLY